MKARNLTNALTLQSDQWVWALNSNTFTFHVQNYKRKIEVKGENIVRKFTMAAKKMQKTITKTFEITILISKTNNKRKVVHEILNLLGGCKHKIYYMRKLSYCKFCIFVFHVLSK